jgi:hypothetical protein
LGDYQDVIVREPYSILPRASDNQLGKKVPRSYFGKVEKGDQLDPVWRVAVSHDNRCYTFLAVTDDGLFVNAGGFVTNSC